VTESKGMGTSFKRRIAIAVPISNRRQHKR
jgi:hypothetical protein